jgi:hypothetical protein
MNFETVQQEITTWDELALRRLIAYAVILQDRKSGQSAADARKLDDPDPARWVSLEEVDRRLGIQPEDLE